MNNGINHFFCDLSSVIKLIVIYIYIYHALLKHYILNVISKKVWHLQDRMAIYMSHVEEIPCKEMSDFFGYVLIFTNLG